MFDSTQSNTDTSPAVVDNAPATTPATDNTEVNTPTKRNNRRVYRIREMNPGDTISPITTWTRTVSFSDIRAFMLCQGSYLMYVEGDKQGKRSVRETIGRLVHAEVAKPKAERTQNVARQLKSVPAEERAAVVAEVTEMIKALSDAQDEVEANSTNMQKEPEPIVWYDDYTDTYWYAKPDDIGISRDERGQFLFVIDNKTTKSRHWSHFSAAFFFGLVAKGAKALGFSGTVRVSVRYLLDTSGKKLERPYLESGFIGRTLSEPQDQTMQGIQATIKKMDEAWQDGAFSLRSGGHCKGCSFQETCPKNREWLEARRLEREAREQAQASETMQSAPANDESQDPLAA